MDAFKIGHLRRVTRFHERFEPLAHQLDQTTAQHGLLAEQVRLAFLAEGGLDNPGASPANARRVGKGEIVGIAGRILGNRQQARNARAARIFRAHRMAGPLGRNHAHIHVGARVNQVEMNVQAMGEQQR